MENENSAENERGEKERIEGSRREARNDIPDVSYLSHGVCEKIRRANFGIGATVEMTVTVELTAARGITIGRVTVSAVS